MSEMVERVARALCAACGDDPDVIGMSEQPEWKRFENDARVAIDAMREPTRKMLKAACASMSPGKRPTPDRVNVKEKHRIRYGAMIDAALNA